MQTKLLKVKDEGARFPKATLVAPAASGYIQLAAEVDRRPPFFPNSRRKRALISVIKEWCRQLEADPGVVSAVVFDVLLIPPGRGEFLKRRPGKVHVARFDLAVLIETESPEAADAVRESPAYQEIERAVRGAASFTHAITANNARRIAPVDHRRQGVFLFNYFFADDTDQNLGVWEHTAGWFQKETNLDNSTVLLPREGERSEYNVINHCRWDRLRDVLPSLVFKRSFRTFVLANFEANDVAAMPILYRMA
jgi:hypothetical protein